MFQGVWNVAAAFCAHERASASSGETHFGHHQQFASCDLTNTTPKQNLNGLSDGSVSGESAPSILDSHHDHLPSFSHFIIVDDYGETERILFINNIQKQLVVLRDLYQSPHLDALNPPPEERSLFVG